jgi:hypothetical protein
MRKPEEKTAEAELPERRNRSAAIGLDSGRLGRTAFARAGFPDPTLVLRWSEIVGAEIARHAQPLRLAQGASGGVLTLRADPAAAVFLQHESRTLCGRINSYLGQTAVRRLRFVPAEIRSERQRTREESTPGNVPPQDPALRFSGREELRAALLALARVRNRGPAGPDH